MLPEVAHRSGAPAIVLSLIAALLSVILGAAIAEGGEYGPFLAVALLGGLAGLLVLNRPVLLVYLVIPLSASASVFREVSIPIGNTNMTVSGLIWLGIACLVMLSLLARARHLQVPRYLWPFIAFSAWALVRWALTPTGFLGLKDVLWYSMPMLFGLFTPLAMGNDRATFLRRVQNVERAFLYSALIPVTVFAFALGAGLAEMTWRGPWGELADARGVPLFLLTVLAVALAKWRYGPNKSLGRIFSFVAAGTIFFTLARMASLLALGLIALSRANPRRKWQILLAVLLAVLTVFCAITQIPVLERRFFFTEDWDPSQGLQGVNTAGRRTNWPVVFLSALRSPLIGHGLGTSRELVGSIVSMRTGIDRSHVYPHNEYLGVFHDAGIVGLIIQLLAWVPVLLSSWRQWEGTAHPHIAKWSMASVFGVSSILISAITDNTFHYAIVCVPVTILFSITFSPCLEGTRHFTISSNELLHG